MKSAIIAIAMLSCLALASCERKPGLYEQPGHLFDMRERLGHFSENPFTDLYKQYAVAFIQPNYENRDDDDYRNYRPSADVCRAFFAGFVGHSYKLEELDQMIVLDACLGYVVGGVYAHDPDASDDNKANFAVLAKDDTLVKLYDTKLNSMEPAEKTCVANLLLNSVLAKKQYPNVECNNHMLQLYIQFAECQAETPLSEHKTSDPYVQVVYQLVKDRVNKCVDIEISHLENALRDKFHGEWFKRASLKLSTNKGKKQQLDYKWATPMTNLLRAVQGTKGPVNLRQVHQLLASIQHDDDIAKDELLKNIADYADKHIKPTRGPAKPKSAAFNDPSGLARYRKLIDESCNVFRRSDSESDYDFATPIIRIVELLNHVEVFDFAREELVKKLITHTREASPLYMSVSACNMLTFTEGSYSTTGPGVPHYEVHFQPDTSRMVLWPKAPFV